MRNDIKLNSFVVQLSFRISEDCGHIMYHIPYKKDNMENQIKQNDVTTYTYIFFINSHGLLVVVVVVRILDEMKLI